MRHSVVVVLSVAQILCAFMLNPVESVNYRDCGNFFFTWN